MVDVTATGKGCGPESEVCRELNAFRKRLQIETGATGLEPATSGGGTDQRSLLLGLRHAVTVSDGTVTGAVRERAER